MKKFFHNWFSTYKLHLLIWILFITYETVLVGLLYGVYGHPLTYLLHYSFAIVLFYTHSRMVLRRSRKLRNYRFLIIPVLLMTEMLMFILFSFMGDKLLMSLHVLPMKTDFNLTYQYCLKTIYRGILFMGFSTGYYFIIRYNTEKMYSADLEKNRLSTIILQQQSEKDLIKAQNAYLKAQINPHFLFNTLDFIYHNIVSTSPSAGEAVIVLADMMRYAIDSDKMGDFIVLRDEIEQVENYIKLNQIRKKATLAINFNYDDGVLELYFLPLVLLTLVENIFKHGDLSQPEYAASVNVFVKDKKFRIETSNRIDRQYRKAGTHTGLENIDKRLKFTYGLVADFEFTIFAETYFKTSITLPLNSLKERPFFSELSQENSKVMLHGDADQL